jgi:hypothetical protein
MAKRSKKPVVKLAPIIGIGAGCKHRLPRPAWKVSDCMLDNGADAVEITVRIGDEVLVRDVLPLKNKDRCVVGRKLANPAPGVSLYSDVTQQVDEYAAGVADWVMNLFRGRSVKVFVREGKEARAEMERLQALGATADFDAVERAERTYLAYRGLARELKRRKSDA